MSELQSLIDNENYMDPVFHTMQQALNLNDTGMTLKLIILFDAIVQSKN